MNSYSKGKRFGFAVFKSHVHNYGEVGIHKADKACTTCEKYSSTGEKSGKKLSKQERAFYKGAVAGFREYYKKYIG